MSDAALIQLATAAGLAPEWTDASGQHKVVPLETLRIVLAALGLPAVNAADIAESERLLEERGSRPAPLRIVRPGEKLPFGEAPQETGYHRIEAEDGVHALAVAPPRCFTVADAAPGRRLAALAVQLYSLRGSAGFGDLAALAVFAGRVASLGVDAVAVSPLHALLPGGISPYSPSTRFFLNPLYAAGTPAADDGADALVDWPDASRAKLAALREAFAHFENPPEDFETFQAEQGERLVHHAWFEALDAHFRAQGIMQWQSWPAPFRDSGNADVRAFARDHQEEVDFHIFLQWLSAKGLAAAQSRASAGGMAIGLIADIAVGMDPHGSHAWSAPGEILTGLSIGAPPDIFNPQGQDWGLTALSPTALRESGYTAFIDTLRANMRHAGGVRIDHAMGLYRLWLVPRGAPAGEGVYLHYPMHDLLALVALESQRHRAIVIGEDLGTVPDGFREATSRAGMMGMEVLWFQRDGERFMPPWRWSAQAAALSTTHDLPTIAGWWRGRDIDWLEKLGRKSAHGDIGAERRARGDDRAQLWSAMRDAGSAQGAPPPADDPAPAVAAALDFVGRTSCELAIVPVEDILALPEQPNIPGTIDEHPNWRRRLPPGDALASPQAQANLGTLHRARSET